MKRILLLDLDMTLVDTSALRAMRERREWSRIKQHHHLAAACDGDPHLVAMGMKSTGVRVGVVTSSPSAYAAGVLTHFGITVDVLVGYHDTPKRKPHPDPIILALERLGASADEAVYVGDEVKDIEASHAAGVVAVAALWGAADVEALHQAGPDVALQSAAELLGFGAFTKRGGAR